MAKQKVGNPNHSAEYSQKFWENGCVAYCEIFGHFSLATMGLNPVKAN